MAPSLNMVLLYPNIDKYHKPGKVWGEITYRFPNVDGCTAEGWE